MAVKVLGELKRRGVLGALTAYGVVAAGGLQLGDIVVHALELPSWSMRLMIWLAAAGLPLTGVVSWFWDLTRHGFVRTEAPLERSPATPRLPSAPSPAGGPRPALDAVGAQALQALGPGSTLMGGRYQIERELGRGGMGRVLAATDQKLGRRVAIKVVTGAHEPARVRRFEQEARTVGSLDHPNVLAIYDLGEEAGVPFLVTELLQGHTLRTVLSRGPLELAQVRSVALQLARGLAAAHARSVVHRDLKPENLFLTDDGRLKILDFGLAKLAVPEEPAAPGLTVTGAIFGTPGYLSPEQARGERAGAPSDVFSAGAVLYELLSGERAFPGDSLIEAGHRALTTPPRQLSREVPPQLAAIIGRCLAKSPAERFADGGELARALEAEQAGQPVAPPRPLARSYSRSTALALAAAGLALGAAIASAVLVRARGSSARQPRERSDRRAGEQPPPEGPPGLPEPPPQAPLAPRAPEAPLAVPAIPALGKLPGLDPGELESTLRRSMRAGNAGLLRGAETVARVGQTAKAEQMIRSAIASAPGDPRPHLLLFALQRRTGRASTATEELTAAAHDLDGDEWMDEVVQLYLGHSTEEDVLEAAKTGTGDLPSRFCQAFYYLGLLQVTAAPPRVDRARHDFEQAIAQHTGDLEADLAREELLLLRQSR